MDYVLFHTCPKLTWPLFCLGFVWVEGILDFPEHKCGIRYVVAVVMRTTVWSPTDRTFDQADEIPKYIFYRKVAESSLAWSRGGLSFSSGTQEEGISAWLTETYLKRKLLSDGSGGRVVMNRYAWIKTVKTYIIPHFYAGKSKTASSQTNPRPKSEHVSLGHVWNKT